MPSVKLYDGREVDYIEVYEEPNHRKQFQNQYLYAYIAGFNPGETCQWHRHSKNTFYTALSTGKLINRPTNKEEYLHTIQQGDKWWNLAKQEPFVHQVCMLKECDQQGAFFGFEVTKPPPIGSSKPLPEPVYKPSSEYSKDYARIYDMTLAPGQSTGQHSWSFYGVVIAMSNGSLQSEGSDKSPFAGVELQTYGGFKWFEGPAEFAITNTGSEPYKAVIMEWLQTDGEGDEKDTAEHNSGYQATA